MQIKSNQYLKNGVGKTYYYIVNEAGQIFHYSDGKFRSKALINIRTYSYESEFLAQVALTKLKNKTT